MATSFWLGAGSPRPCHDSVSPASLIPALSSLSFDHDRNFLRQLAGSLSCSNMLFASMIFERTCAIIFEQRIHGAFIKDGAFIKEGENETQ
jgi:hypothetical protein